MNAHVDLQKLFKDAVSAPNKGAAEDIARMIMSKAGASPDDISRSITTATGLVAYDLQAPAKNLYPVMTPLRNAIPRVSGGIGVATNWKAITAITGSGYDAMGWVAEGKRAAEMSYTVVNKAASYVTIGEEDSVTFEASSAAKGFEDVNATSAMRMLQKMMMKEEVAILGGNLDVALGTPATPSVSVAGTSSVWAAATYKVIVVALTLEGLLNCGGPVNGVSLTGLVPTKTVTGADGQSFTLNGGFSAPSAASANAVVSGSAELISASTTALQGAVAYAWFAGTAGNEKLQKITTINSVVLGDVALKTGTQAASALTVDVSTNDKAFNGLLYSALKSGSGAYVKALATGTPGTGTKLTASGKGSCTEVDEMLFQMWENNKVGVSVIYVGSVTQKDLTTVCLSASGGASLLSVQRTPDGGNFYTAGNVIEFYFNPYTGQKIPVKLHPNLPAGMIVAWAADLPAQYQSNEVPNVAEVKERVSYYQIDWPIRSRKRERGVYVEEVLAVYAPFAMGVIYNIAPL